MLKTHTDANYSRWGGMDT